MIGRLHHVVLPSRDPRQTAQFWARILDLSIVSDDPSFVVVASNEAAPGLAFRPLTPAELAERPDRPGRDDGRPDAPVIQLLVNDFSTAIDEVWRAGCHPVEGREDLFADPDGNRFQLIPRRLPPPPEPRIWRRFVAIGDSVTEGMVDSDGHGQWIGWADRFAAHIATHQAADLAYANLAISGFRLHDIRTQQFEAALAMEPDLLSIVGGVNDVISLRPDFDQMAADLDIMFARARARGITVISFTNPDISRANPLATVVRDRLLTLNGIVRRLAREHDVLFVDFEHVPVASDPRLWGEDRLHINTLGHVRVAAGMAWLLGLPGFDRSWAVDMDDWHDSSELVVDQARAGARSHLDWARRHFGPWVVAGLRGKEYSQGKECKRPTLTTVEVRREHVDPQSG
ncbi:MAG: GDSL-type esterase/lipase family protein [Propionibacteriaceae bacterium]|nr:GDSL-type esterase/lipase family protein [Propionibacteriaceae bacterium]